MADRGGRAWSLTTLTLVCGLAVVWSLTLCGSPVSAARTDNDVHFATSGQSLWGPGAERPGPARVNLLNDGWNQGGSVGDRRGVSGFGEFGGSITASTNGNIRTSIGTSNFGRGAVAVSYPVRLSVFHPDPDNFRPGDAVRVSASQVILPGANVVTTAPSTGSLRLSAQVGIAANVSATACVFGCSSFPMLNLNFRPPELPVVNVPMGSVPSASVGPASLVIENNGPGTCQPDQIAIPPTSGFAQRTGVSGCIGKPSFATATSVAGDGKTLLATGADEFMFISLDLDNWLSKIRGAPKFGVAKDFRAGRVSADALDVDLDHRFTLAHGHTFAPNILVTLSFPFAIPFVKHTAGGSTPGLGSSVTFAVGESVDIIAPEAVFDVVPTFTMDNRFQNNTELTIDQSIEERVMQAHFGLGGISLVCSPQICSPWGSCCCSSCLSSPSFNFGLGPLFQVSIPTKVFRDSSMLDRQRPPWKMAGFTPATRGPINFNPNFFPIPDLEGPVVAIDEGADAAFSASRSSDPDGDILSYSYDFGDNGTGTGPTAGENVVHQFGDNGTFTVTVFASDGFRDPVPATFDVDILNVAPVLSSFPSPAEDEGDVVSVSIDLLDPGFLDTFIATFDWGDGSAPQLVAFPAGATAITDQHVYADDGQYTVDFCVKDDDGAEDCDSLQTTISNLAPTQTVDNFEKTFDVLNLGESLDVTYRVQTHFIEPGTLDTHTARIDWGDSSSDAATVFESPTGPPGSISGALGFIFDELTHNYDTSGTYPVQICVEDDEGAETCTLAENLVVPEADLEVDSVVVPSPPGPVAAGTNIKYTYTVTNHGQDSVDMVELVDTLPRVLGDLSVEVLSAKRGGDGNSEQRISPDDFLPDLRFGVSLDVVGNTMAVGALGVDEESAYIFARSGEDWVEEKKLAPGGFDRFGNAVALSSDEQTLALAAESVPLHVFTRDSGSWTELAVNLTSTAADAVLRKLDMSGDTIVVSGRDENSAAGVVLVVERDDPGTPGNLLDDTWEESALLTQTPPVATRRFGQSVAISGDIIAVTSGGSIGGGLPGAVTLFTRSGAAWPEQVTLTAADVTVPTGAALPSDSFGQVGVALDGTRLAIASGSDDFDAGDPPGSVVIFELVAGSWVQEAFLLPNGGILALLGDGDLAFSDIELNGTSLVVGGYLFDASTPLAVPPSVFLTDVEGAVFFFLLEDSIWQQASVLAPSVGSVGDFVGAAVDVAGQVVYAGAPLFDDFGISGSFPDVGGVFEFKICEEFPAGTVTCGLGSLGSGESAGVEILARVGCALNTDPFVSVELSNTATVDGNAIDPDLTNNTATDVLDTSVAPQGVCGQDLTPPLISPIVTGTLGQGGWYVSDVTIDWTVFDPDSPITSSSGCTQSTVTSDTAGVTFTCSATHTAVNSQMLTTTESVTIKRDTTLPAIAPMFSGTAGDNGWFTSDVSISFDCTDALSGVSSCSTATVVSDEGSSPAVIGVAIDEAGNRATTSTNVQIDKTPPTIVGTRTAANANGWNRSDVAINFACGDSVSGIASCTPTQVRSSEGAGQSSVGTARNKAGLEAMVTIANINIDKTAPLVSTAQTPPANAAGWNNTAVEVSFVCSDGLSGIGDCPSAVVLNSEGAAQMTNGTATDLAGNQASTSSTTNIDATPPTISAAASPQPGGNGVTEPPVSVSFTCADALSGVDVCPGVSVVADAGFGRDVEGEATDKAGNSAVSSVLLDVGTPAISPIGNLAATEGGMVGGSLATLTAAASSDGLIVVDWGDGTRDESLLGAPATAVTAGLGMATPILAEHVFADDGTYLVSVSTNSLAGGAVEETFEVSVSNAPPTIESVSVPSGADATAAFTLVVTFADDGSADTHTANVRWGDGSANALGVTENPFGPPGAVDGALGFAEGEHSYRQAGSYVGEVCVTDDDGAAVCENFVIEVAAAASSQLTCRISVSDVLDEAGPVTRAQVQAIATGTDQDLSFQWFATEAGITFDDATSGDPEVEFDGSFDRSAPFLVGVNISSLGANGEPILCQAACGRPGPDGPLLGQCVTSAALTVSPAPALSSLGVLAALTLLLLIAARHLRSWPPVPGVPCRRRAS